MALINYYKSPADFITMRLTPEIKTLAPKKLIGIHKTISLAADETATLWKNFMTQIKSIDAYRNEAFYALQTYPDDYFTSFDPHKTFEKWAAVELKDSIKLSEGFESFAFEGGQYAIFKYQGLSTDTRIFQYIYAEWLPKSGYKLDNRPHFELLGDKYKNNDPQSEEYIYIPIKA